MAQDNDKCRDEKEVVDYLEIKESQINKRLNVLYAAINPIFLPDEEEKPLSKDEIGKLQAEIDKLEDEIYPIVMLLTYAKEELDHCLKWVPPVLQPVKFDVCYSCNEIKIELEELRNEYELFSAKVDKEIIELDAQEDSIKAIAYFWGVESNFYSNQQAVLCKGWNAALPICILYRLLEANANDLRDIALKKAFELHELKEALGEEKIKFSLRILKRELLYYRCIRESDPGPCRKCVKGKPVKDEVKSNLILACGHCDDKGKYVPDPAKAAKMSPCWGCSDVGLPVPDATNIQGLPPCKKCAFGFQIPDDTNVKGLKPGEKCDNGNIVGLCLPGKQFCQGDCVPKLFKYTIKETVLTCAGESGFRIYEKVSPDSTLAGCTTTGKLEHSFGTCIGGSVLTRCYSSRTRISCDDIPGNRIYNKAK